MPRTIEERAQARLIRYKELKKWDKSTLVARINTLRRIHGCSIKDSKEDLVTVVLDIEHPMPKDWSPS